MKEFASKSPMFANGAASAAFSYVVMWGASKIDAGGGGESVEVVSASKGGIGQRQFALAKKHLTIDSEGNMNFTATVGYEDGQQDTATDYVEGINGTYEVSKGDKTVTLTINVSLTAGGAGGDIRIVSFESLVSQVASANKLTEKQTKSLSRKLWDGSKGDCVLACAAPSLNVIYFRWYPESYGLHETFHLMGFMEHTNSGIMQEGGKRKDLKYNDLNNLRNLYTN